MNENLEGAIITVELTEGYDPDKSGPLISEGLSSQNVGIWIRDM